MYVPGLNAVKAYWHRLSATNRRMYSLMLFTMSDRFLPEYIDREGVADLELWTSYRCAFLLLHPPPAEWISTLAMSNNISLDPFVNDILRDVKTKPLLSIDGQLKSIDEVFMSLRNPYLRNKEIHNVLSHFQLENTAHPCFIFFKSIDDNVVWVVPLKDMRSVSVDNVARGFQRWFASRQYKSLVRDLQND